MKLSLIFLFLFIFRVGNSQNLNQLFEDIINSNESCYVIEEPVKVDFEYLKTDTLLSIDIYGMKNKINWDSLEIDFLNSYSDSLFQSNLGKVKLISKAEARVIKSVNNTLILPEGISDKKAKRLRKRFLSKKKKDISSYSYPLRVANNYYIIYQSHMKVTTYSYYSLYYWNKDVKKWIEQLTFNHMKE